MATGVVRGGGGRRRLRRDDRGAVLVMSVAGFVLALVATALSVDIGRQALAKREDQAVADMAALDAARDLAGVQAAAEAAARRNGFDPAAAGNSLLAERGVVDAANTFAPDPNGTAVRVTVGSTIDYVFAPGGATLTARAVARMTEKTAAFHIGSSLAAVDTSKAPLVSEVLGAMIGGNADVVGWQGLLSSSVTLGALQQQLAGAGLQVGTVDQLLDAELTLADLAQATADALSADGDSNAALYSGPNGIKAQSTSTSKIKLGDFVDAEQGNGDAALDGQLNAWQLLVASAVAANGTNFVSVPDAGISVPGVVSTSLSLSVIEGPTYVVGAVGKWGSTGQVELTVTTALDAPVTITGLTGARVTGTLPVTVTAAGATGTLTGITCPNPSGGITVRVDTQPFSGSGSTTLRVSETLPLVGTVPVLDIPTTGAVPATTPATTDLAFAYPAEFTPTAPTKRAGSTPVGLGGLTQFTQSGTPVVLGTLAVPTADVVDAVYDALGPLLDQVDAEVLSPLLGSLGVSMGASDVWADKDYFTKSSGCDRPPHPVLVG